MISQHFHPKKYPKQNNNSRSNSAPRIKPPILKRTAIQSQQNYLDKQTKNKIKEEKVKQIDQ
jgi:hypothetical protein